MGQENEAKLDTIFAAVLDELEHADIKHGEMEERIEGFFTLLCETMELGREVFRKNHNPVAMKKEAKQCAAMGIKFLRDCT